MKMISSKKIRDCIKDSHFRFEDIAGNHIIIKRKIADTMHWITLHAYYIRPDEVRSGEIIRHYGDLMQTFIDYTAAPGIEYEYAIVPVINHQEGSYYGTKITPETKKLVICTSAELWATLYTDGFCDNQRNTAPGVINTLNDKYPTIVDNSMSNYETVNVTAEFYPVEEDECTIHIDPENPSDIMRNLKRFKDFLMNRKNKFLKNLDGRMWFCYVTTPPSDNAKDIYWNRQITFGVTEIADVENEEALYNAGFITATSEWWNRT